MAVSQYRYLFADLLTNQVIAELPMTGVNFTQQLNSIGSFAGHILLSGVNTAGLNVQNATIPARNAIYVDWNGELIWGGIIWSRSYDSEKQTLTINAREFESYFERRLITTTTTYTNLDQCTVAQELITLAQSATYGNIGVQVGSETSGVNVTRTYYGYELKSVHAAIQDLSKALNGFDYNIYVSYDNDGNPQKNFQIGYPRYGKNYTANQTGIPVLELGVNMVNYVWPEDGSTAANSIYALGAGSNEGKLISNAQDATKLTTGWPLLEDQVSYNDITDTTLLGNLSTGKVQSVSYPPTTFKVTSPPFVNPGLDQYDIGDTFRIRFKDDFFPAGLDALYRLIAINVTPGEAGPERTTLTFTTTTN
jgi:hypothetical protein